MWDRVHVKAQDILVVYYQGPIKRGAMVLMIAAGQGAMPWIGLLKYAGNGRAQRKGRGGAGKKGHRPGYSTRPKSSKESWPEALAEQARSLGRKHRPSKQGVSIRFIG